VGQACRRAHLELPPRVLGAGMRILITNPYCWPYVRRGAERFMSELSRFLARRGHDVTVLSTSPHRREEEQSQGVRVVREREIDLGWASRLDVVRPETGFALVCRRFLDCNSFDLIHCLHHVDVLGAIWASRARQTPCVYHMTGIPFAKWVRRHPWETAITRAAVRHAARVLVVSTHAAQEYQAVFPEASHTAPCALPIPCELGEFFPSPIRDVESPRILFMGALTEARKGAVPLAKAFGLVSRHFPGARLQYCGDAADALRERLLQTVEPACRERVDFLGRGQLRDLPRIYGEAAVTVLPAVEEAFGMVLVESLASGTPVVGSGDAGMADIVEPGVGNLFDPKPEGGVAGNIQGLADAIVNTIGLHAHQGLTERCLKSSRRFAWDRVGPRYEQVYEECLEQQGEPV
jgi:phosphatidyl-myo-inositol alpha-mannosyltransferase